MSEDRNDLDLEQRMFLLGNELRFLPPEPEPINREYYNLGLEVYQIEEYLHSSRNSIHNCVRGSK
jgi:hypothetical protein